MRIPLGIEAALCGDQSSPDQVQIYESVMRDRAGRPTTGLLTAVGYAKDNRLLPRGFEKATADPWIAVIGDGRPDAGFYRWLETASATSSTWPQRRRPVPDRRRASFSGDWLQVGRESQAVSRRRKPLDSSRYYESMASSSSEVLATCRSWCLNILAGPKPCATEADLVKVRLKPGTTYYTDRRLGYGAAGFAVAGGLAVLGGAGFAVVVPGLSCGGTGLAAGAAGCDGAALCRRGAA